MLLVIVMLTPVISLAISISVMGLVELLTHLSGYLHVIKRKSYTNWMNGVYVIIKFLLWHFKMAMVQLFWLHSLLSVNSDSWLHL